jgi:hypothetical protein
MSTINLGDDYKRLIDDLVEEEDYEKLLKELLAVVHRDGGHYTILCGLSVSVLDGIIAVQDLIYKNREMKDALDRRKKNVDSQGS